MLPRELQLPRRETELPVLLIFSFLLWHTELTSQNTSTAPNTMKLVSALQGETVKAVCGQRNEETEGLAATLRRNSSSVVLCYLNLGNFTFWSTNCTDRVQLKYNNQTKKLCAIIERISVKDSDVYSCTLDHTIPPPVKPLNQSNFSLAVSALPVVEICLVSSLSADKEVTFSCSAWDFYPGDIQLSWNKDGQLLDNSTRNDSLFQNSNGSFSFISNLTVSEFAWNESAQFSCQVNHSALKMPIVKNFTWTPSYKESSHYIWIWSIVVGLSATLAATILTMFVKLRLKLTAQSSAGRGLPQTADAHLSQESQIQATYALLNCPPQENQIQTTYSLLSHYPGSTL